MSGWAGSQYVCEEVARYGWVSSRKRAANSSLSRSNPGSDHNTANITAYALDFATFNGAPLAYKIARHYGLRGYRTGNYSPYYVRRGGGTYRLQVLWAVQGHYNHVHLGARKSGGSNYRPRPKAKPSPYRHLEKEEKFNLYRLFYHRKGMWKQQKTGKGKKYYEHLKWARHHKAWLNRRANLLYKLGKKSGWKFRHRGERQAIIRKVVNTPSRIK